MLTNLKSFFFNALIKSSEKYLNTFDEKSGRFLSENGGWAVTLQDPVLAYSYLYTTNGPDNRFYMNKDTLSMIIKAVKALRDFQYPDGQLEFIKVDGSKWGPIYMPWTFYHWLETYALLEKHLPKDIKEDWTKGLMPAFENFNKCDTTHIHNIPVWNAMSLHRAGVIFNNDEWKNTADQVMKNTIAAQHPDGFWPEHKGPTVSYNYVYAHALGLYRYHGGSIDVLETLKRSLQFHQAFTYPDGSTVETIDGRVKYHKVTKNGRGGTTGLVGFLSTAGGISYITQMLDLFSSTDISLPHTASLLIMLDNIKDSFVDDFTGYSNFNSPDLSLIHGSGSLIRKGNRQVTLSSYTAPLTDNRWGLDRQSFVSVWDEKVSLVLGSGNSKYQPQHSTFVIEDNKDNIISYIPETAVHIGAERVELNYAGNKCTINADIAADGTVVLDFSAKVKDGQKWHINLPLKPELELIKSKINISGKNSENIIIYSNASISFTEQYKLELPSMPFNPYEPEGISALDDGVALLTIYPDKETITVKIKL